MNKRDQTFLYDVVTDNLALMSKIYQSFETLVYDLCGQKIFCQIDYETPSRP